MRCGHSRTGFGTTGLKNHNRLVLVSAVRGSEKLPWTLERFKMDGDYARCSIIGRVLKKIDLINVNLIPKTDAPGKTESLCRLGGECIHIRTCKNPSLASNGNWTSWPFWERHEATHEFIRSTDQTNRIWTDDTHGTFPDDSC